MFGLNRMEQGDLSSVEDIDEYKALTTVLHAHRNYSSWAIREILNPKSLKYESLTHEEKRLLSWFPNYLAQLDHSIQLNRNYFELVADTMAQPWGAGDLGSWFESTYLDLDKVRGVMNQYVREWSSEGASEREISFGMILKAAETFYPDVISRQNVHVLVPGAGLGRLVVEFVKRGFRTEGNELSYHMLLNSNFLLSNTYCENNFVICPFIHKSSNVEKRNYQCRQVYFPDFNPGDISFINKQYPTIPVQDLMSMVAGGFTDLYGPPDLGKVSDLYTEDSMASTFRQENQGKFHIVATSYFLDTATNIIDYLSTILNCLNDDGYWINFGPLLWHFENDDNVYNVKVKNSENGFTEVATPMKGLELSKDDLLQLINDIGFEFIEHQSNIESPYGGDDKALASWNYKCGYWVCRKKLNSK